MPLRGFTSAAVVVALFAGAASVRADGPATRLVSVGRGGAPANGLSGAHSVSASGRYVAFQSTATNLVPRRLNHSRHIYLRDLRRGRTEVVDISSSGKLGNSGSYGTALSADGRYVAFCSWASNFAPGDTLRPPRPSTYGWGHLDTFVRARKAGRTIRVSVPARGRNPNDWSCSNPDRPRSPAISADGRYVAFASAASNLVAGDLNGQPDVFVRDLRRNRTIRVSTPPPGVRSRFESWLASISGNGRFVFFCTHAPLVRGDRNGQGDMYVYDQRTGKKAIVSRDARGRQLQWGACGLDSSYDGRYVLLETNSPDLVGGLENAVYPHANTQLFVKDRRTGALTLVTGGTDGKGLDHPILGQAISGDGRFVVFATAADNVVTGDGNRTDDVFRFDRLTGRTTRVSVARDGGDSFPQHGNVGPSLSSDGRFVTWVSDAPDLVAGDSNGHPDVFIRGPLP